MKIREGRRYADFLEHLGDTDEVVVEMDTVAGCRGSKKTILTLHFRQSRLLLAFLMDDNTQKSVVHALDGLEQLLGKEQFQQALPVILADNGMEFLNPSLIETSNYGGPGQAFTTVILFHLGKRVVLRKIMWSCEKCYQKERPLTHYSKRSCCWRSTISTVTPESA